MVSFDTLQQKQEKVCVVGLGYVGLPLAVLLAKQFDVIGFDIDERKIAELKEGTDRMGEVSDEQLAEVTMEYTAEASAIHRAKFLIVAVPTPVDENNIPDLTILKKASETVGKHISEGSIVVFESTVYPGATEEVCLPIIEEHSGLQAGEQFFLGYSPERVNPGDKKHTIDNITKVVSGTDAASTEVIAQLYGTITNIHRASSIRVAEAAKIIENTQRDINIALMNELSQIFHKMGIDTYEVLEAAGTKWNFLKFEPGLVGGHCIGVDPYYLTFKAQQLGHKPQIILAGREINDGMHGFVVDQIMKHVMRQGKDINTLQFVLAGITFKENVPDVRNSKAASLFKTLKEQGITAVVHDPVAAAEDVQHEYGIVLSEAESVPKADVLIVAVKHAEFAQWSADTLAERMNPGALLVDVKHVFLREEVEAAGFSYWSL